MKLYEIDDAIEMILARGVDHETGEISHEAIDALDELEQDRAEVALAIAKYIKGERLEAEGVAKEAKAMAARAKRHFNKVASLERYIELHVPADFYAKDNQAEIDFHDNPPRVVLTPEAEAGDSKWYTRVDPRFVRTKIEHVLDKKTAAEYLKQGEEVKGLRLVQGRRLVIK